MHLQNEIYLYIILHPRKYDFGNMSHDMYCFNVKINKESVFMICRGYSNLRMSRTYNLIRNKIARGDGFGISFDNLGHHFYIDSFQNNAVCMPSAVL